MTVRPVRPVILLVVVSTKGGGISPSVDAQSVDEVYNSTTSWSSDGRRLWAKKIDGESDEDDGESDEDYTFDIFLDLRTIFNFSIADGQRLTI